MAPQRPKSPSPAQLPAVSDTVVGLDPVADSGPRTQPEPVPEVPSRETTAPIAIPPSVMPPRIEATTTPEVQLSDVAPALAAQVLEVPAPGANSGPTEAVPLDFLHTPKDPFPALGATPDATPINPQPALTPKEPAREHTSRDPLPALTPKEPPAPDVPWAKQPFDEVTVKPRRTRDDVPAAGAPRKSRIDVPAIGEGKPTQPNEAGGAPPRKSRIDVPALAEGKPTQPAEGPGRKSRTDVPAAGDAKAATPRKSRTDVPAGEVSTDLKGLAIPTELRANAVAAGPGEVPPTDPRGVGVPTELRAKPVPGRKSRTDVPASALPPAAMAGSTVMHTMPAVPPVRPFEGIRDPRVLLAIGVFVALVVMTWISILVLKHQPEPIDEDALKPTVIELPAPPRTDVPPSEPAAAVAPKKRELQIEIQVDAGVGQTKTVLVPAGVMHFYCEPEANVVIDGKDYGPQPAQAVLPAGRVLVTFENKQIGLHKTMSADVIANEEHNASWRFFPGWLEVVAPDDAKVLVDGKVSAKRTLQVWEGHHRVEAVFGHQKTSKSVEVIAGETTSVDLPYP